MPPLANVRGRFVSATGEPVVSAKVIPFVHLGQAQQNTQVGLITDADGRFTIPGAAGDVEIQLQDVELGACHTTVKVGSDDVDAGTFTIAPPPPDAPAFMLKRVPGIPYFGFFGTCEVVKRK